MPLSHQDWMNSTFSCSLPNLLTYATNYQYLSLNILIDYSYYLPIAHVLVASANTFSKIKLQQGKKKKRKPVRLSPVTFPNNDDNLGVPCFWSQ